MFTQKHSRVNGSVKTRVSDGRSLYNIVQSYFVADVCQRVKKTFHWPTSQSLSYLIIKTTFCSFYMIDCVHTPYSYYLSQFGDQWINLLTNENGPLYIEKLKYMMCSLFVYQSCNCHLPNRPFTHKKIVQRR